MPQLLLSRESVRTNGTPITQSHGWASPLEPCRPREHFSYGSFTSRLRL